MVIDVSFPKICDLLRREKDGRGALYGDDIHPFDVGVIICAGALGKCRDVIFYIAGLVVVFIFVREAVEVAEELAEKAASDFVLDGLSIQLDELAGAGVRGESRNTISRKKLQRDKNGQHKHSFRHSAAFLNGLIITSGQVLDKPSCRFSRKEGGNFLARRVFFANLIWLKPEGR